MLTEELLPLLKEKRNARVINVSSGYGALDGVVPSSAYRAAIDRTLRQLRDAPPVPPLQPLLQALELFHPQDAMRGRFAAIYKVRVCVCYF